MKKTNRSTLNTAILNAKKMLKAGKPETINKAVDLALKAARAAVKNKNIKSNNLLLPRILKIPTTGNALPALIPIFAAISALGSLVGGTSGVIKAISSTNDAKKSLAEASRHNQMMESIAIGKDKHGNGLYLKPYKSGFGLYQAKKKCKKTVKKSQVKKRMSKQKK